MNYQLPVIIKYHINGIVVEFCYSNIPDIFQQLWFDPIKELELPDTKRTDKDFKNWLFIYRHTAPSMERILLEESRGD